MDRVRDIRFRVYLTFSFIILFAIMIIGKALYIQIVKGDELRELASKMHQRTEKLVPDRGNIYSEDGTLLVSSTPRFDLRVDMKVITNDTLRKYIDEIAKGLSTILNDNSTAYYKNKIITAHKNKDRYFLLKKNAKYYEYQQVRALPIFNKAKNKGGFIVEARSERDNPFKLLAFRTLGLWRENASNVGIEQKYDTILSGKPGSRMLRKTTGNTWVPIEDLLIEPVNGKDIVSTIDINIQDVTEHALLESLQKHGCQFGTAVVMEVATGKIKAMANLGKQKDGSYWEDYNYALTLSEPGSTFKLMSLYALLEDDYVKITDNVNVEGGLKVFGKQRVRDDHLGMGTVTIEKAFAKSSNVAFAKLINQFYAKDPMRYINHLRKMHLHEKTGIDLVGEVTPIIKTTNSKSWNKVTSLPWIAYGYESLITPLHTLMVYNAIANNGKMMKPYLVSEIQEYGKTIKKIEPVVLEEKLGKKSTIQQLRKAMTTVVEDGTAKTVKSLLYNSGGKTGTAQVADHTVSYADGVKQGSFVGYFPAENPKYTIMVLVRSVPHGAYYGAVVAAPVYKTIADKLYASHIGGWEPPVDSFGKSKELIVKAGKADEIKSTLALLGINIDAKGDGWVQLNKNTNGKYVLLPISNTDHKVPNVLGMGLKDAVLLLETAGLNVQISGLGKVIGQSIPAGDKIVKGQTISLQLS